MDLAGLEDDPDFWNMVIDDGGDDYMAIKDLTNPQSQQGVVVYYSLSTDAVGGNSKDIATSTGLLRTNFKKYAFKCFTGFRSAFYRAEKTSQWRLRVFVYLPCAQILN